MAIAKRRIWYDITMALTFPSVLGAVIYSLLDTGMREGFNKVLLFLNLLNPQDVVIPTDHESLLNALGLSPKLGLAVYLLITLCVAVQYSCDYLYSKYFEAYYSIEHFLYDLVISAALGISFVGFSGGVRGNIGPARVSFGLLWVGFVISYMTYLLWDYRMLRRARAKANDEDEKAFFRGMVFFEFVCLGGNIGLLLMTVFLRNSSIIAAYYVPICLIVMAGLSGWFFRKVWLLEAMTRRRLPHAAVLSKGDKT
jgi:hypothetical protein